MVQRYAIEVSPRTGTHPHVRLSYIGVSYRNAELRTCETSVQKT